MEPLIVHQALYGYRDGHRLLASSCKLPSDAARALLVLSDRSGPSLPSAFDGYLTATSLPDLPVYALCRTYDAPELPRPGCVYTHALLIEWADLSRLPDLRWLARLHRRPSAQSDDTAYLEPIHAVPEPAQKSEWSRAAAESLLAALYASPEHALVLPADNGAQWESLVLATWSQMWPRLRRHFRFSTGSMSLRGQARREFDLHIVPRASAQRMKGDMHEPLDWVDLDVPTRKDPPMWLGLATEDLTSAERTPLRNFLVQHTVDIEPRRSLFPLLADAFALTSGRVGSDRKTSWFDVVETVADSFPQATEACRLKQTLLGTIEPDPDRLESARLWALARTQHAAAFNPISLQLSERTNNLFHSDRQFGLELLSHLIAEPHLNSIGQRILEVCASRINQYELTLLEKERAGSIRVLLSYNISLATLPQAWQCSEQEQAELIRTIANYHDSPGNPLRHEIAKAIILHANEKLADVAIECMGRVISDSAVLLLSGEFDNSTWQSALERNPSLLLNWIRENKHADQRQLVFVIKLLPPKDPLVREAPVHHWLDLLSHVSKSALAKRYLSPFLLSLGLQNIHEQGAQLCVLTFAEVWYSVDVQDIPTESWKQLQSVLPGDGFLDMKWKRKERLAKALVGSYVRYNWPPEQFLHTLKSPQLLEDVADSVSSRWEPSPFLKSIAREVDADRLRATAEQWRVIKKWL
jgi:hypothetical protein